MNTIPVTKTFDSSLNFLREPYQFISSTAHQFDSKVFETRLLLERTICMTGADAARIFTDENLFTRKGAAPEFVRATLLGKGGLQNLDGEAHIHRKELFMSFIRPASLFHLRSLVADWLEIYSADWQTKSEVILYPEFKEILTRAVCSWAGIDLREEEVKERTEQLSMMFDQAGAIKHFASRKARKKAQSWICNLVTDVRDGKHFVTEGSPVYQFIWFKDINGELLSPKIAAVEILNLLRPTVAVSLFLVFSTHALILHPECRQRLKTQEPGFLDNFVNEVRRYYPFFPALFARVKQDFDWNGMFFKQGTRVMLDIYGTNHDEDFWDMPYRFNPDRYKDWNGDLYSFIPQGVGDHYVDHRCPGELITIELMRLMVEFFVHRIEFQVPHQNLRIDMSRLPAAPKSELKITNVRRIQIYSEQFV